MQRVPTNSTSLERRIKSVLPMRVKGFINRHLTSRLVGKVIQKYFRRSLLGAYYDFTVVEPRVAASIFFGLWESAEIEFSKRHVRDHDVIVELGSSLGATLATLVSTKKISRYIAVEANPNRIDQLHRISRLFDCCDITIIGAAVDYSGGDEVDFLSSTILESKVGKFAKATEQGDWYSVHTATLSEILKQSDLQDSDYVLITDIEGAESDLFFEDLESLRNCGKILCELESTHCYSVDQQIDRLEQAGYEMVEFYGDVYCFVKS